MHSHVSLPSSLNIRSKPMATPESTIVAVLPTGSVVDEMDANADRSWLRIRFGAVEGWCSNSYLLRLEAYKSFPWVVEAAREFGVAEIPGSKNNPRIQAYLATTGGAAENETTAWCSAFAKWCVLRAQSNTVNIPSLTKITAAARSWSKTKWGIDLAKPPALGSVVVLWRRREASEDNGKDTNRTPEQVVADGTGGHVGFLCEPFSEGDQSIVLLGGNQSNRVCKDKYTLGQDYGILSFRGI
jgi:uncharacterized protein (TIGR02594 family)